MDTIECRITGGILDGDTETVYAPAPLTLFFPPLPAIGECECEECDAFTEQYDLKEIKDGVAYYQFEDRKGK